MRVFSRDGGLCATNSFYGSRFTEGADIRNLVAKHKLAMPVLAVDGGSGAFTSSTMLQVAQTVTTVTMKSVGHLVAMEAPEALAGELLSFYRTLDL